MFSEAQSAGSLARYPTVPSPSVFTWSSRVSLRHIAKAALVRDFTERLLQGKVPVNEPTPDSLSHWMASRLLGG